MTLMIDQPEMIFAVPINMDYDPDESEEGVFWNVPSSRPIRHKFT